METLKETQAKIAKQLKFNISRRRDSDEMTRGIAQSDKVVESALGSEKVSEIVANLVESVDLKGSKFELVSSGNTNFSLRNLFEAMVDLEESGKLREAGAESAYGALLRLGVTNIIAKAWNLVPMVWSKILMTHPTTGLYGVYGSTFRPTMAGFVGAGQEFPEVSVDPMGNIVPNVKWGSILAFQSEAVDDDMTGELSTKAAETGEDIAALQELAFATFLQDAGALTEANLTITPTTYTDPDGTTGVYTSSNAKGRQNRPSSYGKIGMNTIKFGVKRLKLIQQPNGRKINIIPDTLVYHPDDFQDVEVLLKSPVWPGSSNQNSSTPGDSTGAVGANNPLSAYGLTPYECRYLTGGGTNGGSWLIGKRQSRSLIYQSRDGLQTLQESPNAGKSFDLDLNRWRNRMRGNWAWILGGARYWFKGNDGL